MGKVFGLDSLIIRPFDKNQWKEKDLIKDFFYYSGIKLPEGF